MLKKLAHEHFVAIRDCCTKQERVVSSWPEALQYLLRSYGTPQAISEALAALQDIKEKRSQSERDYGDKVNQEFRRWEGAHAVDDRISTYIEVPLSAIRPLGSRFREANRGES